jgi:hypothetical protein
MQKFHNNPLEGDILNFQQGVFYKVPIIPSYKLRKLSCYSFVIFVFLFVGK